MSAGTPLTDDDRLPWLALIRSTAERVCREQWVSGEHAINGLSKEGHTAGEELESMADFEFGEGRKWAEEVGKDLGEMDIGLGGRGRRGLGRPAVIIACSALKKYYRDILRGKVEAEPPTKDDLVSFPWLCCISFL